MFLLILKLSYLSEQQYYFKHRLNLFSRGLEKMNHKDTRPNSGKKAILYTTISVFILFFLIIVWASFSAKKGEKEISNEVSKQRMSVNLEKDQTLETGKNRYKLKISGFKNVAKMSIRINCENTVSHKDPLSKCNKTIEKETQGKESLEYFVTFNISDFSKQENNKIEVLVTNQDRGAESVDKVIAINGEPYYYGKAEISFSKEEPNNNLYLTNARYEKIAIGANIDNLSNIYDIRKACEKYSDSDSSIGKSQMYRCKYEGKYAHFHFINGSLSSKDVLNY